MSIDFAKAWEIFVENMSLFSYGIQITLLYAVVGTVCGFLIGLVVGGIRAIEINDYDSSVSRLFKRLGKWITGFYIWVFRGTPMMVQAMFLYYLLKPAFNWTPLVAGLFIISINTGAYMAEIIRAGIQSVDAGQSEVQRVRNDNKSDTYISDFPQAIKIHFHQLGTS